MPKKIIIFMTASALLTSYSTWSMEPKKETTASAVTQKLPLIQQNAQPLIQDPIEKKDHGCSLKEILESIHTTCAQTWNELEARHKKGMLFGFLDTAVLKRFKKLKSE